MPNDEAREVRVIEDGDILVVGGGIAGMAFALRMREQGREVTLVEIDPDWRVYGAGITVTGPTYRAFKRLGVIDAVRDAGFRISTGARFCTPDGSVIADLPMDPIEPDLPTSGGLMRPDLHRILSQAVMRAGVDVRLGRSIASWEDDGKGIEALFDDGSSARFGLLVAADGAFSRTRTYMFPAAPQPAYTGQFCWRVVAPRPAMIDRSHFFMGAEIKAGLVPVTADRMYMWLLSDNVEKEWIEPGTENARLCAMMAGLTGPLGAVRDGIGPDTEVNVRPLEALLLPPPWHKGRAILIGDAAHSTTPHLASGAGIAVEDALVLSEELSRIDDVEAAFESFTARRWERCRLVVENSVGIGKLQQSHAPPSELQGLLHRSELALLAEI